jgi:MiaB/RimO family radical SAM methylthiotransferase
MHQGCNRNCTFCIVPSTRGRERSRTPDDILCEVQGLVKRGTREVVLLSQIAERYGRDLVPRSSLAELLAKLDAEADGLQRIRFLTSYPADFHPKLIEAIATLPKVVEDINLPIQSGDDEVLQRMRRGYTYGFYRDLVGRMRERIPNLSMATDIIVGFPGETEAQFENTLKAMAEIKWDVVHIAAYSTRTGTPAAEYEDQLPLEEKKRRVHEVERLQKEIATAKNAPLLHTTVEVLIEGQSRGKWYGRTRSNKLVHIASEEALAGQLVVDVGQRAHRRRHDRPHPRLDVEVDADRLERQHDVGEEDGGVDAVPAHRLEGDLDDHLGVHARLEHADALADREVLRQRPPGLSHEPHRASRRHLAGIRTDQRRILRPAVDEGVRGRKVHVADCAGQMSR